MTKKIVSYFPKLKTYVEPFAGLARTAEYIKDMDIILNDKSEYSLNYLRDNFKHAQVTEMDFMECILTFDSKDTLFFIDPPWTTSVYKENDLPFCDRKAFQYYDQLLEVLPNIKGVWFLASSLKGSGATRMRKAGYPLKEIISDNKPIFGLHAKTLLMSNIPFESC